MDKIIGFLLWVITLPAVLAYVASWLVSRLKVKKEKEWLITLVRLATNAYEYAEAQGLAQGLRGYAKFDPFMDKFILEFRKEFGYEPAPEDKGKAVEIMEQRVINEKKERLQQSEKAS
jgi:hypothetical protein